MEIFFFLIFLSAVYAIGQKKSALIIALFLLLLTEVLQLLSLLIGIPALDTVSNILGGLLLAYTATIILFHLFREDRITGDMIMGAICVYFLMGLVRAFVYSTLEFFQPGSFQMPQETVNQATFTYYSYVTLTTLGYGEITPISAPARSFALLEAMMGPALSGRSHCQIGGHSHRTIEPLSTQRRARACLVGLPAVGRQTGNSPLHNPPLQMIPVAFVFKFGGRSYTTPLSKIRRIPQENGYFTLLKSTLI